MSCPHSSQGVNQMAVDGSGHVACVTVCTPRVPAITRLECMLCSDSFDPSAQPTPAQTQPSAGTAPLLQPLLERIRISAIRALPSAGTAPLLQPRQTPDLTPVTIQLLHQLRYDYTQASVHKLVYTKLVCSGIDEATHKLTAERIRL